MASMKIKAVILIGGPSKGTRFRPLSLELPKPIFPIGGYPLIAHHIEAIGRLPNVIEILIIGFYQPNRDLNDLLARYQRQLSIPMRYLQEFASLGTAGGIYQFRDQINAGSPDLFFVMNSDICGELPLMGMLAFHSSLAPRQNKFVVMGTEATRSQSNYFGCIVECPETHEVTHYVEKPETFVSTIINCGVYLFTPAIFNFIRAAFLSHQDSKDFDIMNSGRCKEEISMEKEVFPPLAGTSHFFVYHTDRFWSQIKNAGAVIYANRHILSFYERNNPERLMKMTYTAEAGLRELNSGLDENQNGQQSSLPSDAHLSSPIVIGHVYIHPNAKVDPTAVIGPNVSISEGAVIRAGVRLRDCIVLHDAEIKAHACCINSVIGWSAVIGEWARVEGTPNDPNPNKPFTKIEVLPVFNKNGQFNPSITVIGTQVNVPAEAVVFNSIVLPHKDLTGSVKNQIIL